MTGGDKTLGEGDDGTLQCVCVAGTIKLPLESSWKYKKGDEFLVLSNADGEVETEKIPAEIWRSNESQITKVFFRDKEVVNITIDPLEETADVNMEDNHFPKREEASILDKFKEGEN